MPSEDLTADQRENYCQSEDESVVTWQCMIAAILEDKKQPAHLKQQRVVDAVFKDLLQRFDVFVDREIVANAVQRRFLREKETGEITPYVPSERLNTLWLGYGLLLPDLLTDRVEQTIYLRMLDHAKPITICGDYHYRREDYRLYVATNSKQILRMSPDTADLIANGDDDLLFLPSNDPFSVDLESIKSCTLGLRVEPGSSMYDAFNATYANEPISSDHQRQIVVSTILHMFFPRRKQDRPMLIIDGEPGSGKTWLADSIGSAIRGGSFTVTPLPDKTDALQSLLTTTSLAVLDNMDQPAKVRKHTDLLCQAVTGGEVSLRRLFSTLESARFQLTANLICTSVDLSWVRDTIADRAILIHLLPRPKDGTPTPEEDRMLSLQKKRDVLLNEILGRCRNIVIAQREQAAYCTPRLLRTHGFTSWVMRAAVHEGWAEDALAMFRSMATMQTEEADTNNPVLDVVQMYLGSSENFGEHVSATTLHKRLTEAAHQAGIDWRFEVGAFGTHGVIQKQISKLKERFGLCRRRSGQTHPYQYWFDPEPEVLQAAKQFARQTARCFAERVEDTMEDLND